MHAFLPYILIYAGILLMVCNITLYIRFLRHIRSIGNWEKEQYYLVLPIALLILFLIGYLSVAVFGKPDLVIAGILSGGSVFVFAVQQLLRRVTERIREEEHLEAELEAAKKASEAKTFFLSNMSHDIRTPLNAVLNYTALAMRQGSTPDQIQDYLKKIDASGRHLLSIVDDVLEMSRIESGKYELNPEPADLTAVIRETADLISGQMEEKRISFHADCAEVQHPYVLCDRNRLTRALMNMLGNACKFTPEGGEVSLTLTERTADDDYSAGHPSAPPESRSFPYEIRVKDSGIGMSPEFAANIFLPFERERTSTVSRIDGTGLGMAITKGIVDLMNGEITLNTAPGKGSEFTLRLRFPEAAHDAFPETAPDTAPEVQPARAGVSGSRVSPDAGTSGPSSAPSTGPRRLLLAEDNEVNREIAGIILTDAGYQLDYASNGLEALEMVSSSAPGHFSAVLMDIQMPVMDGLTAAKKIRALENPELAAIPIIAMTANAFAEDVQAAKLAGMNAHIAKPLDIPKMMKTLEDVLNAGGTRI